MGTNKGLDRITRKEHVHPTLHAVAGPSPAGHEHMKLPMSHIGDGCNTKGLDRAVGKPRVRDVK